jgi:hypothetical protein
MSGFDPILNNPTLGYRLDPYEPGLLRHAKASQSTAQVVSQEHRNLTRLSRQAIEEGRVIIRKQITYKPVIAGSYMGIAAGRTTVVSMEKSKPEDENPSREPKSDQENCPSDFIGEGSDGVYTNAQPELTQLSAEELTQEEQNLRVEIGRITTELEQLEREKAHAAGEAAHVQAKKDHGRLELELERKKQELGKVALAKIMKSQSELLAIVNEGLFNSFQVPISMITLAHNASSNSAGQNLDLFI